MALQKSLGTAKKAVTEAVSRDIIKQMKSGITDKSLPVQRAAAEVHNLLYKYDFFTLIFHPHTGPYRNVPIHGK